MLAEILRLDSLIADCLLEIQKLKSTVVSLGQYEYAAQIRDAEKQFEIIKENLSGLAYPIVPSKGLTRNGATYSSQLFSYGQSRNWKNLPDYICNLFKTRKTELNSLMEYTDTSTESLGTLNARLKGEESRINEFLDYLLFVYKTNCLETSIEDFSYGGIVVQFLTSKDFTSAPSRKGVAQWSFYEIEIPMDDWKANAKAYYETNIDQNLENALFLQSLPIALRDDKICYLYYYLGSSGFLALQDMLNIDRIIISFSFICRLKKAK